MMFAVHVEQRARPDLAVLEGFMEWLNPKRFDQEKIQACLGALALNAVDEVIIRIQLVRHHEVIGARRHGVRLAKKSKIQSSKLKKVQKSKFKCRISEAVALVRFPLLDRAENGNSEFEF